MPIFNHVPAHQHSVTAAAFIANQDHLHGDLIPLALRATFPEKNFGIVIASLPSGHRNRQRKSGEEQLNDCLPAPPTSTSSGASGVAQTIASCRTASDQSGWLWTLSHGHRHHGQDQSAAR